MRADKYLSQRHAISRRQAQELFERGLVTIDGRPVSRDEPVERLDPERFEIDWPVRPGTGLAPENIPLAVVYEDDDIAVIDKPAGMVCHPFGGRLTGTLVNALLYRFERLSAAGGPARPGIVHRLDRETSGLLVVARHDRAHRFLSEEFRARRVRKCYTAFAKGVIPWSEQQLTLHLSHNRREWCRMGVGLIRGRESVTRVRVTARFPAATETTVYPLTGRTHQIRVVLYFLGFPIIGDKKYGARNALDALCPRHALHAGELAFRHPTSERVMTFHAPLPGDLARLRDDLTAART